MGFTYSRILSRMLSGGNYQEQVVIVKSRKYKDIALEKIKFAIFNVAFLAIL